MILTNGPSSAKNPAKAGIRFALLFVVMRFNWLIYFTLIIEIVAGPLAVAHTNEGQRVRVQITENTNVRSDDRNVLVPEMTLPAGSVVEVSTGQLEEPILMKFWNALIGREEKKHPFVKGIKLISAPGFTAAEIREFNRKYNKESLYMSKKQLEGGDVLSTGETTRRVRTRSSGSAYRSHDMRDSEADRERANQKALERIKAAQNALKGAGTVKCDNCNRDFFARWLQAGVPEKALRRAIEYYNANRGKIRNSRYITINDYSDHSGQKRMYVLDTATGGVERYFAAHGSGSDGGHGGFARRFGNSNHKTPGGIHLTGETYHGRHGLSMRLDGMEAQNSASRRRAVVLHSAPYASASFVRHYGKTGRSLGCVVVDPSVARSLVSKLRGGSVMLNYTGD